MKGYLFRLLNHEELSREEMKTILIGITQSEYPNEQITALLTCLQMRGVTVEELLGFRDGILETGVPAILDCDRYIDVVGTGGDRKNTFNISTTACFVIAGAGYKVAKHGNYAATSVSGASNVIAHHGIKFTLRQGHEVRWSYPQGTALPHHLQPPRSYCQSLTAEVPAVGCCQSQPDAPVPSGVPETGHRLWHRKLYRRL